jgi:hypothetical protein
LIISTAFAFIFNLFSMLSFILVTFFYFIHLCVTISPLLSRKPSSFILSLSGFLINIFKALSTIFVASYSVDR